VTDAVLIARVLTDDDPQAFDELVERYQSPVRALLLRLTRSNQSLSDELAQDTFLQAYRSLRNFKGDARFSTWLHRLVVNTCLDGSRKSKSRERSEDPVDLARFADPASQDEDVARRQVASRVQAALSSLPAKLARRTRCRVGDRRGIGASRYGHDEFS